MKYLVMDTETSSLFDFAKPADAEGQARLASAAFILLDEALHTISENEWLIRPNGWEMTPEATKVNGFTTEFLAAKGEPVQAILDLYAAYIDEEMIVCAFNAQFDTKVMRGEMRRAGMDDRFTRTPNICVMRGLTDVCKIPRKTGKGFKFPKLSEACALFNIAEPAAHSALGDARSAVLLLRELHKMKLMPKPEVHFARVQPTTTTSPTAATP